MADTVLADKEFSIKHTTDFCSQSDVIVMINNHLHLNHQHWIIVSKALQSKDPILSKKHAIAFNGNVLFTPIINIAIVCIYASCMYNDDHYYYYYRYYYYCYYYS